MKPQIGQVLYGRTTGRRRSESLMGNDVIIPMQVIRVGESVFRACKPILADTGTQGIRFWVKTWAEHSKTSAMQLFATEEEAAAHDEKSTEREAV